MPTKNTLDENEALDLTRGAGGDDEVFDFSAVKSPEPVPVGVYHVKVKDAKYGRSKPNASGGGNNPMIQVQYQILKVIEGGTGDPDADAKLVNRIVFDNLTFTQNTGFRVKKHLQALGFDKAYAGKPSQIAVDMLNREAYAAVNIAPGGTNPEDPDEVYPDRNRVAKLMPVESAF